MLRDRSYGGAVIASTPNDKIESFEDITESGISESSWVIQMQYSFFRLFDDFHCETIKTAFLGAQMSTPSVPRLSRDTVSMFWMSVQLQFNYKVRLSLGRLWLIHVFLVFMRFIASEVILRSQTESCSIYAWGGNGLIWSFDPLCTGSRLRFSTYFVLDHYWCSEEVFHPCKNYTSKIVRMSIMDRFCLKISLSCWRRLMKIIVI